MKVSLMCRQTVYEELLTKESEMWDLKRKGRELMMGHENSVGYTEMKQQLNLLGQLINVVFCLFVHYFCTSLDSVGQSE